MSNEGIKTTATPGPPQTTTLDNPKCTCCTPQQPLESPAPGQSEYLCPVTGKKYTFDPAEGVVKPAASALAAQSVEVTRRETRNNFFPEAPPDEEVQRVNPRDPFA